MEIEALKKIFRELPREATTPLHIIKESPKFPNSENFEGNLKRFSGALMILACGIAIGYTLFKIKEKEFE